MSRLGKILVAVAILLVIMIAGFLIWANTPLGPMPEALAALQSDSRVEVETEPWLIFRPTGDAKTTGLIIYPGGRVDARSYAPTARAIAEAGYPTIIVPMPLNLAVLGADRASDIIAGLPEVETWAVGGHSLGGAMAANYVYGEPEAVEGMVLWAAYPASNNDLSSQDLAVASIYGTLDGVASGESIDASRASLPPATVWVAIEGGNHAQFGWYGPQGGDNEPTIARQEQQAQVVGATIALLEALDDTSRQ